EAEDLTCADLERHVVRPDDRTAVTAVLDPQVTHLKYGVHRSAPPLHGSTLHGAQPRVGDLVDRVVDQGEREGDEGDAQSGGDEDPPCAGHQRAVVAGPVEVGAPADDAAVAEARSEEHTSELQ